MFGLSLAGLPAGSRKVQDAGVAQLVEQRIRNAKVGGSTPSTGTKFSSSFIPSVVFSGWLYGCAVTAQTTTSALPAADEEAIRALEARSWVAWQAQDAAFFDAFLSDDHVEVHGYGVTGKASVVSALRGNGCAVRTYTLGPMSFVAISVDSAMVTYRAEQDTHCGAAKVPSPVWATSVYVRRSGKWLNVLYQQTPTQ